MSKDDATASPRTTRLFDVSQDVPKGNEVVEQDGALLERARAHWQMGEWPLLAALAREPLDDHPDRAKLALLAAVGLAQEGDMPAARAHAVRARDWGCDRQLLTRVLIAGVYNSLGRASSLFEDEDRAVRLFEGSVATVTPHGDARVLGRARNIHEKARLGQLPEAAKLMGEDLQTLRKSQSLRPGPEGILKAQLEIVNSELRLMQQRGQLGLRDPKARLETRAASQLGQDLWVLEQTNMKRGGYFVEFGATDGVLLSNTWLLEKDFDWNGVCAEPNPKYFAELRKNRTCTVAPDCILGETGRKVDFILADEYGAVADFAGADKHSAKRDAYRSEGYVQQVESISLDDFLRKHDAPRDIDYMSIDTEGSEYDILRCFPFDNWNIRLLTIEHNFTEDRARIRSLMEKNGYRVTEQKWDDWYFKPDPSQNAPP